MSSPATDARLAAAAKGFTQIVSRGPNHLITRNPQTLKCSFDTQISNGRGWHKDDGTECDSAWVAGVAPWNYQVLKCDFNLFALSQFNSGQILKWLDPSSGQYVTFQPTGLNWTNALDQIQQISMPQSVAAQVSDDVLTWNEAYGPNTKFQYVAGTERLQKLLILAAGSLPSTTYDTLELNFIMAVSSGVSILVNGQAWNKKNQVDTIERIEFRLSDGRTVWSFATPSAWDSSGDPETGSTTGAIRLKKQGGSLYVSVRFPKSFFDGAQYPVYVDPTVDYQVGASADDGYWQGASSFSNTGTALSFGPSSSNKNRLFFRFTGVTIPDGATIDASYLSWYYSTRSGTPAECDLYFEDAANPAAVSSFADGEGRTKTTATIKITHPSSGAWWNSNSINSILTELLGSYSYASGAAMQVFVISPDSAGINAYGQSRTWDYDDHTYGSKLHIEYTKAAAGNPFYAYAQQ